MVNGSGSDSKRSYTIPCSTSFRDAVLELARRRGANAADLARSVVLTLPLDVIDAYPDPGEPAKTDRETIILQSGAAKGRPWRRKPRLQVRLGPGYGIETIRRALAVALALDGGTCHVTLSGAGLPATRDTQAAEAAEAERAALEARLHEASAAEARARNERDRLRSAVAVLSFAPLRGGVRSRADALHVLGFAPEQKPDQHTIRSRFRTLATIHHPDGEFGDHERMAQLNEAIAYLRNGA